MLYGLMFASLQPLSMAVSYKLKPVRVSDRGAKAIKTLIFPSKKSKNALKSSFFNPFSSKITYFSPQKQSKITLIISFLPLF
jgi:hypothetical protein